VVVVNMLKTMTKRYPTLATGHSVECVKYHMSHLKYNVFKCFKNIVFLNKNTFLILTTFILKMDLFYIKTY
jgi:hypothetical protein